jgi:hypothetical protein
MWFIPVVPLARGVCYVCKELVYGLLSCVPFCAGAYSLFPEPGAGLFGLLALCYVEWARSESNFTRGVVFQLPGCGAGGDTDVALSAYSATVAARDQGSSEAGAGVCTLSVRGGLRLGIRLGATVVSFCGFWAMGCPWSGVGGSVGCSTSSSP